MTKREYKYHQFHRLRHKWLKTMFTWDNGWPIKKNNYIPFYEYWNNNVL